MRAVYDRRGKEPPIPRSLKHLESRAVHRIPGKPDRPSTVVDGDLDRLRANPPEACGLPV
jgi:hypothetical protein